MKNRIYNGNALEFFNSDNSKKGEIKISGSDIIINPLDSSGTVIFGEEGTINDIEVGAAGTPVDFTFLGGGTITSNGGTLTLGNEGDTVDLSNATIGTITASIFQGGEFIGDGSGLTGVTTDLSAYTGSVNISGAVDITGPITGSTLNLEGIVNAGTDTDKFLVLDSDGNIDFRTGANVLSDIGGQASGNYVVDAGGATGQVGVWSSATGMSGSNGLFYDTANSRLGIGTASPSKTLHTYHATVNEVALFESGDSGAFIQFKDNNTNQVPSLGVIGNNLTFRVSGSEAGRFDIDGNFGIGTTSPKAKLHISGSDSTESAIRQARAGVKIWDQAIDSSGRLQWGYRSTEAGSRTVTFTLDDNNNVGIGTSAPGEALEVVGNISASGQVKAQSLEFDYQQSVTGVNSAGNDIVFLRTDSGQFGAVNGHSNIARALQTGNTNGWQIGSTDAGITGKQSTDTVIINTDSNEVLTLTKSSITASGDFSGSGDIIGESGSFHHVGISNIVNAGADTDKFLVISNGSVKFRTGANVLSDIGATSCTGTVTGAAGSNTQVQFNDSGNFGGSANLTFDGTNLTVGGKVIAEEIVTNIVSQSVAFATGSTIFGDQVTDKHSFTGSLNVTGSLFVKGADDVLSVQHNTAGSTETSFRTINAGGNEQFTVIKDSNKHTDVFINKDGTTKVAIGSYWPTIINNENYSTRGGLVLGPDLGSAIGDAKAASRYGLYVSAGPESGSAYFSECVTFNSNITASGNISASGLTTTNTLTVTGLSNQASEATALMINGSNIVGTRELGSNAFTSTTIPTNHVVDAGGAAGQVGVWSSATEMSGSNNFFYNSSNGRVGIGTTSPEEKLTVAGNISGSGGLRVGSGTFSGAVDTCTDAAIVIPENKAIYTLESDGNYLRNLIKKSNDIIQIGQSGTALITQIRLMPGNAGFTSFYNETTEVARVTGSCVGIGTTSPTSKLDIVDDLSAQSTVEYPLTLAVKDDNNNIDQLGGEGVGIKFKIAGNDSTDPGNSLVGAGIAAVREAATDSNSSTGIAFLVSQNDETLDEKVRIDHDGKVGIGTNAPDYKLDVAGNAGINEYLYHNGDTNTYLRYQTDQVDIAAGGQVASLNTTGLTIPGNVTASGNISGSGTGFFHTLQARNIKGDGEKLILNSDGGSDLQLKGDSADFVNGSGQSKLLVDMSAGKPEINSDTGGIIFNSPITSSKLIVTGQTQLSGLSGQASEATALMINGSNVVGTRELGSNAFSSTTFVQDGGGAAKQVAVWADGSRMSGSNDLIYDTSNGRLGIGTNSPSHLLHVDGNATIGENASQNNTLRVLGSITASVNGTDVMLHIEDQDMGMSTMLRSDQFGNSQDLMFKKNSQNIDRYGLSATFDGTATNDTLILGYQYPRIHIGEQGGGNVGIGMNYQTNPAERLTVRGNISGSGHLQIGYKHKITGVSSSIAGGHLNCIDDNCSFIGGGYSNHIQDGHSSVIAGGCNNCISGSHAGLGHQFVGGGCGNKAMEIFATVGGGGDNCACGYFSVIGGGESNVVTFNSNDYFSGIFSGCINTLTGNRSFIGGGSLNIINGPDDGVIAGGRKNCITGNNSFIGAGILNTGSSCCAFIGGGQCNKVLSSAHSAIAGGCANCISGTCALSSFIGGGKSNTIFSNCGFIGGGTSNCIHSLGSGAISSIVGGSGNKICAICAFIGGGSDNIVCKNAMVVSANDAAIVAGKSNCTSANCSFIGGGKSNQMLCNGTIGTIVGGDSNKMHGPCGFIGGGCENTICSGETFNVIVGGESNIIDSDCSFIGGGSGNCITGNCSGILGGFSNCITHTNSYIVGCNLTSTADLYTFMNNACIAGTTRTNSLVETSAKKHKECIEPLQDQLDNIKKLEPIEFQWKKDKVKDIGFIAEEVEKVYPNLIAYEEDGEIHGLQYSKLTSILVKAVQEQQEQIEELKKEIFILKEKL